MDHHRNENSIFSSSESTESEPVVDFVFVDAQDVPEASGGEELRRPRLSLSPQAKQMLVNLFNFVYQETLMLVPYETPRKSQCVAKVCEMLEISSKTVYRVLREYKENSRFKEPGKTESKNRLSKFSEANFATVKHKVQEMLKADEKLSLKKVHAALKEDKDLPKCSLSTTKKLLLHLKIKLPPKEKVNEYANN